MSYPHAICLGKHWTKILVCITVETEMSHFDHTFIKNQRNVDISKETQVITFESDFGPIPFNSVIRAAIKSEALRTVD